MARRLTPASPSSRKTQDLRRPKLPAIPPQGTSLGIPLESAAGAPGTEAAQRSEMTQVRDLMVKAVCCCHPSDSLARAAHIMWDHDCGSVIVVDGNMRVVGIITDRDVCMGAFTHGRSLSEIPVAASFAHRVFTCSPSDSIEHAERLMIEHQVRRLPVVGDDGLLVGVLSVSDLAQGLKRAGRRKPAVTADELAAVVEAVSRPRRAMDHDGQVHPVIDVDA
jgi:CBS domain-containing protein